MDSPAALLQRYGLRPKKSWGQCFLHDATVVQRIVEQARLSPESTVVEIGAGLGALTGLLAQRAGRVLAIERDRDLAQVLRQELGHLPAVEIVEHNALTFDFGALGTRVEVLGNLPYNISSPLLFHLLEQRQHLLRATVMLQRELADRIVAGPGSRTYGVPSVLLQQHCEVRRCFNVSRGAFLPAPRVDSAVIQLTVRQQPLHPCPEQLFSAVVHAALARRRKTLRNALGARFAAGAVAEALRLAQLDGTRRGETLSVSEFAELTNALLQAGAQQG